MPNPEGVALVLLILNDHCNVAFVELKVVGYFELTSKATCSFVVPPVVPVVEEHPCSRSILLSILALNVSPPISVSVQDVAPPLEGTPTVLLSVLLKLSNNAENVVYEFALNATLAVVALPPALVMFPE